jgi:hypothetical protein
MIPSDYRRFRTYGIAETVEHEPDPVVRLHTPPLEPPAPRTLGARIIDLVLSAAGKRPNGR